VSPEAASGASEQTAGTWAALSGGTLRDKADRLDNLLDSYGSALVAFSGGVDSALLAVVAARRLGDAALCVTAESPSYPARHRQLALTVARDFGLRHEFISTTEVERPAYRANPVNRCYHCKTELYSVLAAMASARGFRAVLDGNNADDRGDYRPGRQAAREHGVHSPLDAADLTKDEIRALARELGMSTWDEPASACLSSRVPYHTAIDEATLARIERAEAALHELGFRVCRVRHHQDLARIEFGPDDLARALDPSWHDRVVRAVRQVGYADVIVDPRGYRRGSLNEGIALRAV
jgi:uncharacterized protein